MADVCTSRLHLRPPSREDALDLVRLMTPTISARLASWPPYLNPATAQLRVEEVLAAQEVGLCLAFVVTRRSDSEILGWISAFRPQAEPQMAILTYWVGEAYHGQGIMREAALAALSVVFREMNVAEVRAAVQSDNTASHAVLRALGMHLVGPGRIWCGARGREESCEWWAVRRAADQARETSTLSHVVPTQTVTLAAAAH